MFSTQSESLMDPNLWVSGQCLYLNDTRMMRKAVELRFEFTEGNFAVFVHDPNYFVFNINPLGIPNLAKINFAPAVFALQMTKHHKINLPSQPCEEDTGYNFTVSFTLEYFFFYINRKLPAYRLALSRVPYQAGRKGPSGS